MLGLVAYDSDEDEEMKDAPAVAALVPVALEAKAPTEAVHIPTPNGNSAEVVTSSIDVATPPNTIPTNGKTNDESILGPSIGPARPLPDVEASAYLPEPDNDPIPTGPPLSPYSTTRSLQRAYTTPTLSADFSLPESPPASPIASTAAKFQKFIQLKSKGTHFNTKLSHSSALRNPNLLDTLLGYVVDEDEGGKETVQYASNWNKRIWDPTSEALGMGIKRLKGESFVDALGRMQKEEGERRQKDRSGIIFTPASTTTSAAVPSGDAVIAAAAANAGARREKYAQPKSAAERIMAGLDRDSRKNTPEPVRRDDGRSGKRRDDGSRADGRRGGDDGRRRRSRSRSRERGGYRDRERDYRR